LSRIKVASPVLPLPRFPLGALFAIQAAHERRHLQQAAVTLAQAALFDGLGLGFRLENYILTATMSAVASSAPSDQRCGGQPARGGYQVVEPRARPLLCNRRFPTTAASR
jgi:hypothetical protein